MAVVINKELAATVLLEAAYTTDEKACARYDVSVRSLQRWRRSLASDPDLAGLVHTKKEAFDKAWAESLPLAMRSAVETITAIAVNIREDPLMKKNPLALEKVAGALKTVAEVYYTGKMIDARITPPDRPQGGIFGQETDESDLYS
jgi:hypothetical protein